MPVLGIPCRLILGSLLRSGTSANPDWSCVEKRATPLTIAKEQVVKLHGFASLECCALVAVNILTTCCAQRIAETYCSTYSLEMLIWTSDTCDMI